MGRNRTAKAPKEVFMAKMNRNFRKAPEELFAAVKRGEVYLQFTADKLLKASKTIKVRCVCSRYQYCIAAISAGKKCVTDLMTQHPLTNCAGLCRNVKQCLAGLTNFTTSSLPSLGFGRGDPPLLEMQTQSTWPPLL